MKRKLHAFLRDRETKKRKKTLREEEEEWEERGGYNYDGIRSTNDSKQLEGMRG